MFSHSCSSIVQCVKRYPQGVYAYFLDPSIKILVLWISVAVRGVPLDGVEAAMGVRCRESRRSNRRTFVPN